MFNNLAILKTFKQDSIEVLSKEYYAFMDKLKNENFQFKASGDGHAGRIFFKHEDFPIYFQNLITDVMKVVDVPYDNIVIQWGQPTSHVVHFDIYRKTNLTIPLLPVIDPVAFYPDGTKPKGHRYGYADKPPEQLSRYSTEHPMLLNVARLHAVLQSVERKERALLQIGWDTLTFDEIIAHNPNIWEIVQDTGKKNLK